MASAVSTAPWLAVISRHKNLVFTLGGALLALNYWLVVVRPTRCAPGDVCHVDSPLTRFNRLVFWTSVAVYAAALLLTFGSAFYLARG